MICHIDFESRSAVDLKSAGLHKYFEDDSTSVICAAFAFDEEDVELWLPPTRCPDRIVAHIRAGGQVWAHNAAFERTAINVELARFGWPHLPIAQAHCTMAMAHAMGLPGGLDRAAAALGTDVRKDAEGYRIMMQLSTPKPDGAFWTFRECPELFERLWEYCKQDVRVERALGSRLLQLSPMERKTWEELDQLINDRGIGVDRKATAALILMTDAEEKRLNERMHEATGRGLICTVNQDAKIAEWLTANGCPVTSIAKDIVTDLLASETTPPAARAVLEIRQEAAKSSTKKLKAALAGVCADGRMRGTFQYHGAFTGRWSGRRFQPHNLPRPTLDYPTVEWLLEDPSGRLNIETTGLFGTPMSVASDLLRSLLVAAPGSTFVSADLSQIEARVLPWLAGDKGTLDVFRGHGKIYEHAAAGIYRVPLDSITKHDPRRQIGKVSTLALGYGGGAQSFISMGKNYGIRVPIAQAQEIKRAWREAHPEIVRFWYALEEAAIAAVLHPGRAYDVGRIRYKKNGSFLLCKLPSGRVIIYPYPKVESLPVPWDDAQLKDTLTYQSVNEKDGQWGRNRTYGGSLAENVTQAVARDVLRDGMLRIEAAGYPIVLHVHDEAVVEVPRGREGVLKILNDLMAIVPDWAPGLPVASEGWEGPRYRK